MQNKAGEVGLQEDHVARPLLLPVMSIWTKEAPTGKAGGRGAPVTNCQIMNQEVYTYRTHEKKEPANLTEEI